MVVLGINAFHGDASACIVEDGKIVAAVSEERFTRNKHEGGLPLQSIKWCLSKTTKKVTDVAIGRDPNKYMYRKIGSVILSPGLIPNAVSRFLNKKEIVKISVEIEKCISHKVVFHNIEHHLAHMTYAFGTSSYDECALLSIDGFGDFVSTAMGFAKNNKIFMKDKVFFPNSLGIFYSALTQFLGFTGYGEEYKVMALASYGTPRYKEVLEELIRETKEGFELNQKYFLHATRGVDMTYGNGTPFVSKLYTKHLENLLGPARSRGEILTERHYDIASSFQAITSEIILNIVRKIKKKHGFNNIAIAGGVALNSVANGEVVESGIYNKVWIPSAPGDDGTAIGAALAISMNKGDNVICQENTNPFLGPEYEDFVVDHAYKKASLDEKVEKCVSLIYEQKIIGWFEGKMEFGPRALGHRSILADPRNPEIREKINKAVKKRENFRPFAPMVLREDAEKYFELSSESQNMMIVAKVKKEWREKLGAVCHVDGTARIQTVSEELLPNIARLLKRWKEKSGVSVLLNTSFNENEPIVCTPHEAYKCYIRTSMDALFLNDGFYVK